MAIQPTTLSPPQTHYISGLTIEQFNGLFEKKLPLKPSICWQDLQVMGT